MDPKISKPCPASWDQMTGDQQSRHCDKCKKSVHNISEMSREAAEDILCTPGKSACIRIHQATNGAFKTKSGWVKRVALAGAAGLTLVPMTGCAPEPVIGKVQTPPAQQQLDPTTGALAEPQPVEESGPITGEMMVPEEEVLMGDIAPELDPQFLLGSPEPAPESEIDPKLGRIQVKDPN